MLRPLLLAFALSVLPVAASALAQSADTREEAQLSQRDYARDVAHGRDLTLRQMELDFKLQRGLITAAEHDRQLAPIKRELDALFDKWSAGVNRRAGVMFSGEVLQQAYRTSRYDELRRRYAPPPKPAAAVQAAEAKPAFDPYLAAQPQQQAAPWEQKDVGKKVGLIFLASFIFCAGVGLFAILWRRWFPKPEEEVPEPETSGNYGTASYAPLRYAPPNRAYVARGVFFGKSSDPRADDMPAVEQPGAPVCSLPANHALIVARTRTGKGTRVIVPTLLRYVGSAVVVDPKGENAAITARARQHILEGMVPGHISPVHILNPWDELDGTFKGLGFDYARLNPLDLVSRGLSNAVANAQALANTICPKTGGKDDFWAGSAANILAAVFLWLADQPGETKTLARAREITSLPRKQFTEQFMVKMAASSAFDGAVRELIGPYVDLASDTYSGIISNLAEGMKFISDPRIKAATDSTSFPWPQFFGEPVTLYVIIPPDKIATQRTWLRLVLETITMLHRSVKPAERAGKHRCLFMVDELAALGFIPDMPSNLATMAGYGIDYALIVQGLDQLKAVYKESAGTILSNCAFKWFCNVSDLDTAKYLSESLGKKTVQTVGKSESSGTNPGGESSGASTTFGETGRPLLTVDEVLTLGRETAIVMHPDSKPHYVRPIDYWNLTAAFSRMQGDFPEMFWEPPLRFDPNPYHHQQTPTNVGV